jgi:hypothetical protein
MPGGVSTSSTVPLQGSIPLYGVGRRDVEPGYVLKGVTISFKGEIIVSGEL